jgi:hypothetical protein
MELRKGLVAVWGGDLLCGRGWHLKPLVWWVAVMCGRQDVNSLRHQSLDSRSHAGLGFGMRGGGGARLL